MFCPKCGRANPDTNNWCEGCGSDLRAASAPAAAPTPNPAPAPGWNPAPAPGWNPAPVPGPAPGYVPAPRSPLAERSLNALKETALSPLYLAAVICMAINALFTVISTLDANSSMTSMLSMLGELGVDGMDDMSGMMGLISFGSVALTVLTVVGLVLNYTSAKSGTLQTTGLTILQVTQTINLVFMCLAAVVIFIICMAAMSAMDSYGSYYGASEAKAGISAVMWIAIGVMALFIVFYAMVIGTIRIAKDICTKGTADKQPSMFVAVMCFILGGLSLIGMMNSMAAYEGTALLNTIASIAGMILFGVVIVQLRNRLIQAETSARFGGGAPTAPAWGNQPTGTNSTWNNGQNNGWN